jgi:nucleoside-diphosphate-sugar epimerase
LTVHGDGQQTRSFCYVDDLVEGIVACASERAN